LFLVSCGRGEMLALHPLFVHLRTERQVAIISAARSVRRGQCGTISTDSGLRCLGRSSGAACRPSGIMADVCLRRLQFAAVCAFLFHKKWSLWKLLLRSWLGQCTACITSCIFQACGHAARPYPASEAGFRQRVRVRRVEFSLACMKAGCLQALEPIQSAPPPPAPGAVLVVHAREKNLSSSWGCAPRCGKGQLRDRFGPRCRPRLQRGVGHRSWPRFSLGLRRWLRFRS
jgi:hypothetical protein